MRFILLLLLLFPLFVVAEEYSDTPDIEQKELYLSYHSIPKKIYLSEVFSVTVKTLTTLEHFEDIIYTFKGASGLKVLSTIPKREIKGHYYFDTFSFIATSHYIKLPTIAAQIKYSSYHLSDKTVLESKNLLAIQLRGTNDFSHIIANNLILTHYKTTKYSHTHNITLFSAKAYQSDLSKFTLNGISKQGFETLENEYNISNMTYYCVIPNTLDNLKFTYFNPITGEYEKVIIPIILEDDSVSTQSDITPQESTHKIIKIILSLIIIAILLILFIYQHRTIYLLLILPISLYILISAVPIDRVCIKKGSYLHVLPMTNSTLFYKTDEKVTLEVLSTNNNFTKVKIHDKIGWIDNDSICKD